MTRPAEEKNTGPLIFHVYVIHKISRFYHKGFLSFSAAKKCYGQTDGQTDGQAQTNMPPQLLRSWGHKQKIFENRFECEICH